MANCGHEGIQRIDKADTHGYQARVGDGGPGKTKFFADAKWGGAKGSLERAIAWREANATETPAQRFRRKPDSRNRSGIVGVRRSDRGSFKRGIETHNYYWDATWLDEDGRSRAASYSIAAHGEWGAFLKACERRRVEEAHLLGKDFVPLNDEEIEGLRGTFDALDLAEITAVSKADPKRAKKPPKARYSLCSYCNNRVATAFCEFEMKVSDGARFCNKALCPDCAIDLDGHSFCRPHHTLTLRAATQAA